MLRCQCPSVCDGSALAHYSWCRFQNPIPIYHAVAHCGHGTCSRHEHWTILACSAKLPTGLYILPSVISLFFFNDFLETNYLRIRWTDFRNLFTEWKRFGCRWSILTSFLISHGTAKSPTPTLIALSFRNGMHYRLADGRINSSTNCSTSCKKMVKIGSIVFELKWGRKWKLCCDLAEIGLYHRISQQLLNQSLPTFQRW